VWYKALDLLDFNFTSIFIEKLLNPDFTSLIENYDILVFQETKTDEFDQLSF
jgi:hypothetical protein